MQTILNFLLFCAFIGIVWGLLEKGFESLSDILGSVLSFFMLGLSYGVILFGIMYVGSFLCLWQDYHLFGYHPFWIGFAAGVAIQLYRFIRSRI
jgi:hypothetical protein